MNPRWNVTQRLCLKLFLPTPFIFLLCPSCHPFVGCSRSRWNSDVLTQFHRVPQTLLIPYSSGPVALVLRHLLSKPLSGRALWFHRSEPIQFTFAFKFVNKQNSKQTRGSPSLLLTPKATVTNTQTLDKAWWLKELPALMPMSSLGTGHLPHATAEVQLMRWRNGRNLSVPLSFINFHLNSHVCRAATTVHGTRLVRVSAIWLHTGLTGPPGGWGVETIRQEHWVIGKPSPTPEDLRKQPHSPQITSQK